MRGTWGKNLLPQSHFPCCQYIKELIYMSDSFVYSIFRNLRRASTQRKNSCASLGETRAIPCRMV